jgi:hypothetical protein
MLDRLLYRVSSAIATLAIVAAPALAGNSFRIVTLSSQPDKISGGDALVRVEVPKDVPLENITIKRNEQDVTKSFQAIVSSHALLGLLTGLRIGQNWLEAYDAVDRPAAQLSVVNFAATGPVFSGPHEQPFVCETQTFRLPDGSLLGDPVDANCSVKTVITYVYRPKGPNGLPDPTELKPLLARDALPADVAWITTTADRKAPYIVRIETGTINRGIYQIAILHDPTTEPDPGPLNPPKSWNGKLLYSFGGGCVGGWYRQGGSLGSLVSDNIVGKGYAEAASTLNVFGTNCQDVTAAETMMMVKEHFIETFGPPLFTFGRGGSGGAYQQLQIADNYPGLLDGIIPSATFPEVLETTQFLTDAQLLDTYFDTAGQSLTEEQRRAISGVGTIMNISGIAGGAGRINPSTFCPAVLPPELRYHPILNRTGARCDIFDHNVNVYGRDPSTGFARRVIDNTGVQYGLQALNDGVLRVDEFLDLNAKIGGYDNDGNIMPGRAIADVQALRAAYQTGRITYGGGGLAKLPIIDFRGYVDLTDRGDVHLKYHSFSLRERLQTANHTTANEVMLVASGQSPTSHAVQAYALAKMDEWLTNLMRDSSNDPTIVKITRAKPADLVDSCYTETGQRIVEPQIFSGGECNKLYPTFPSPRMIAGGPMTNNILKCQLKPIDLAEYQAAFNPEQRERLKMIFPNGVCDWSKPGVEQQRPLGPWLRY